MQTVSSNHGECGVDRNRASQSYLSLNLPALCTDMLIPKNISTFWFWFGSESRNSQKPYEIAKIFFEIIEAYFMFVIFDPRGFDEIKQVP